MTPDVFFFIFIFWILMSLPTGRKLKIIVISFMLKCVNCPICAAALPLTVLFKGAYIYKWIKTSMWVSMTV